VPESEPSSSYALAPEQCLPLSPRGRPPAPERVHRVNGADDHGLAAPDHAPPVRLHEHDGPVGADEAEGRAEGLAAKSALEVAGDRRAILGMHHLQQDETSCDVLHGVAGNPGEGLVGVEDTVVRGHVDADEGLLGEGVEVLLGLGEKGGAALEHGDHLVECAGHVPRLPGQLRARGGIAGGQPTGQVDERRIQVRSANPPAWARPAGLGRRRGPCRRPGSPPWLRR